LRLRDDHITVSWENGEIFVCSEWLTVRFSEPLPEHFRSECLSLAANGHGSRTLQTDNGTVTVTLVMAKRDELHISIRLQQPPDLLNEVRVFFNRPQSLLAELFSNLDALGTGTESGADTLDRDDHAPNGAS
jgi:hypothetical protein